MSKIFHCRCAVAIKFANSDRNPQGKIIAFDESQIEDVKVELSGFNTAFGVANQGGLNPTFAASRFAKPDSTVSVTLNETVLDASWLSLLDVAYNAVGGKASDFLKERNLESIEDIYSGAQPTELTGGGKKVSDPTFNQGDNKKFILEAQGRGLKPSPTQPQQQDFVRNIKDEESFKRAINGTLKNLNESKEGDIKRKTQLDNLSIILTIGKGLGLEPDLGGGSTPAVRPPAPEQQSPPPKPAQESYGKIILAMDHAASGYGNGADGVERKSTDVIAKYIKSEIERKEPKIKVEIVRPEEYVSPKGRSLEKKPSTKLYGCEPSDLGDYQPYEDYIIENYINKSEQKATIISVHLDAPPGRFGGSGAAVWNLNGAAQISEKLSNVILGTYINKFKTSSLQRKNTEIKRWNKCGNRSVRIFQNAPEGYSLVEFGILRGITGDWNSSAAGKPVEQLTNQFIQEQKPAFDALIDGLIQFKKSQGSSTSVPSTSGATESANSDQLTLPEVGPRPGLLVSFWYDVNGYIVKTDYYFIITQASISFGDGVPKLNLYGNSAFSIVFNTWKIQDSFAAGTPIDEVIRKIISSDPTKTFDANQVQFDSENPKERLFEQEDLAGLTYAEFLARLARKFDLQYLSSARTDQLGKIKIFRETRGGFFDGSQVFWLGRGLFEKYEISVVSDITGFATVRDGSSQYNSFSQNGSETVPDSPFLPSDKVNFIIPSGQPSMLYKFNGAEVPASKSPPPGWERIKNKGKGIQVILKLPDGRIWPPTADLELHNLAERRNRTYRSVRSIVTWDPSSQTWKIESGQNLHPATDGGRAPAEGPELIAYFKGKTIDRWKEDGGVTIAYDRWVRVEINGEQKECRLYHTHLHMRNVIGTGVRVDIGTKVGNQSSVGSNNPHMHEEFFITANGKRLYLDPFIVYSYSYSKDASGNLTFDSSARVSTTATGSNNLQGGYTTGTKTGQGNVLVLRTEFRGIPRALQIIPGQTFLNFVTDYNRYLGVDDKSKYEVDPGIPVIKQLKDWMIVKCAFNWSGDLRIDITAHRPRSDKAIYPGQNWNSYRLAPGKGPALDDYYDYIRSIGDLSYRTVDENGNIISSFDSKLKNVEWMTGFSGGSSSSSGSQPSPVVSKCKYTGSAYSADRAFLNEVVGQLANLGLNKIAIAGVLGNIAIESSFGKNIVGGKDTCKFADEEYLKNIKDEIKVFLPNGREETLLKKDYKCFGIVQWGGARKVRAIEFFEKRGWGFAAQISFVVEELRTNEKNCTCGRRDPSPCPGAGKNTIQFLNSSKSPEEAAYIFRGCYERPRANDLSERQRYAKNIFSGITCE